MRQYSFQTARLANAGQKLRADSQPRQGASQGDAGELPSSPGGPAAPSHKPSPQVRGCRTAEEE